MENPFNGLMKSRLYKGWLKIGIMWQLLVNVSHVGFRKTLLTCLAADNVLRTLQTDGYDVDIGRCVMFCKEHLKYSL
jgi:hypothetical protein